MWSPPSDVSPLEPDFGPQYIDQNADRTPGSLFQPLMRAVTTMRPDFDFEAVDVITDRMSRMLKSRDVQMKADRSFCRYTNSTATRFCGGNPESF